MTMTKSWYAWVGSFLAVSTGLAIAEEAGYESGRGLLTLEGPSGLFINPTSATLPKDFGTLQYCVLFPENETDVVGHGLMASYGFTDALEVGAAGNYIDLRDAGDELASGGPLARYRLTKDQPGGMPQISVGAYSRIIGDDELEKVGAFVAAYKRLPISDDGVVRAVGFHVGAKNLWVDDEFNPDDETASAYAGAELQLPLRIYVIGEIQTRDDDFQEETPYAFGVQWRASGIAMSAAGIQNGTFDEPSFFYGIGWGGAL
jgi:hypothetical protein